MDYNDVLRKLRYVFNITDEQMQDFFFKGGKKTEVQEIKQWLKKEDHEEFKEMTAQELTVFLNGFIVDRRGNRGENPPDVEPYLSNNLLFKKLKIALSLTTEDILEMFILSDKSISMHEINSFLRNPSKRQFRPMKDQYLRQFLYALQQKYRPQKK